MICHQPVYLVMNPLESNPMAAFGDLIVIVVVGFVIVTGLSLLTIGAPATPPFARRPATAASVQLRQDPNASFILDRDSCSGGASGSPVPAARPSASMRCDTGSSAPCSSASR